MFEAIDGGDASRVRELLDAGLPVGASDPGGLTPLHRAVYNGEHNIAHILLDRGAPLDVDDGIDGTPLAITLFRMEVSSDPAYADLAARMIRADSQVAFSDKDGRTSLMIAAHAGHAGVCALLIERGVPVNAVDRAGKTALDWALDRPEVSVLLRSRGAVSGEELGRQPAP